MSAARPVLDCTDHAFDVWHMLVGAAGVKEREILTKRFKFLITEERCDTETAVPIKTQDRAQFVPDGGCLAIGKVFNGNELDVA